MTIMSQKGVLMPVLPDSEEFENTILPPLQNNYMYEESKQVFRYNSAFIVKNATLQKQYKAFRTRRKAMGYTAKELEESYGFLLFDDENKAKKLGESGVIPGHSTCTTLGDPSKGVYLSKYSDCLDVHRWYHGKSGYIAIVRLTKGRVKEVTANYTVNYTSPSPGFDCHVSEQLRDVSASTSSFLAFERTQYYMYEQTGRRGKVSTVLPPGQACPFAIVAFSYWNSKTPESEEQEKRKEEKTVFHYYPWRGQLLISTKLYHVGLKSNTGPLMPVKLPKVIAVDGAIKMADLRQKLPRAIFETCFSGEAILDGMSCSLFELVPSQAGDTSLRQLTQELKEKDLALTVQLKDSGFLILLHSFHFLTYEDAGSNKPEALQAMFVFPESRVIQRDTKICWRKACLSTESLQVVPALNYAETEVEKCLPEPCGETLCLLEQHIQSYGALIHPGLTSSPCREASIIPDQFDFPHALKHLCPLPKWTEMGWVRVRSYFHQPGSFELPVSRAVELLAAGKEKRGDASDDDIYYCLSSPEASMCGREEGPSDGQAVEDKATDISSEAFVSVQDCGNPGKTQAESTAPEIVVGGKSTSSEEVQEKVTNVEPIDVKENVPSELTDVGLCGKPDLNNEDRKITWTTSLPKEVQVCELSQPAVLADGSREPGGTKVDVSAPGVVEDNFNTDEVQVEGQKVKMPCDTSQPTFSTEELREYQPTALAKENIQTPQAGPDDQARTLLPKDGQLETPSGLPQTAKDFRIPGPVPATKLKAIEGGGKDKGKGLLQNEVQEKIHCDRPQLAVSAKAFGIASMTVMTKTTEVTGDSNSPVSVDLPTVLVITATEKTETILPHKEKCGLTNTDFTTKDTSSLSSSKLQGKDGRAHNGEPSKDIRPIIPSEVCHYSKSDWRKRPRKRRKFSRFGKKALRSTADNFEKEETEKIAILDSTKSYKLKKSKESMDGTQVQSLKLPRELMNLIEESPSKRKKSVDVTKVQSLKIQNEVMNLMQDPPLKKKESKDSIHFHPLKSKESMDLIQDDHPLKKKTERWDLKAIISECGRIFVPHGSEIMAKDIESLKVKGKVINYKQCAEEMMVEACIHQTKKGGEIPSLELKMSAEDKDKTLEVEISDKDKIPQSSSENVQNKDKSPFSETHQKKHQYVAISLSKLKTVLSRGRKRKMPLHSVLEDNLSPLEKKCKDDVSALDRMESDDLSKVNKGSPNRTTAAEIAKEQTIGLDPSLALALGLTPTELHKNVRNSPQQSDVPQGKDMQSRLDQVTPQTVSSQMFEDLPISPSSTLPVMVQGRQFRKRRKPTDFIQKKWWLHYHTPTSFESENVAKPKSSQLLSIGPDVSHVFSRARPWKRVLEASHLPADALNLLADLALSTSNDKVLEQQPETQALENQDGQTGLVKSDNILKDGGSREPDGEPESVHHALPKHPSAARLKLPPQSLSAKGLVVGSGEHVVLVLQEHSYSLPPSSSLLLGLSGSVLQLPTSEGLQQHHKPILEDVLCHRQDQNRKNIGIEPTVGPDSQSKATRSRQTFRRLRQFVEKDGSVQVTRRWKENYDFNADSKFTNDPKDKTVIRALHGPWDFDVHDTTQQVQLIIHMWIGLFYSRSTARFFQTDSSQEKDFTDVVPGTVPAQVPTETKTSSAAYVALSTLPEPEVLDIHNMGKNEANPLSLEPKVLDLSIKTNLAVVDLTVTKESKEKIDLINPLINQLESGLNKEIVSFSKRTDVELKVYRDHVDSRMSDHASELDDEEEMKHDYDRKGTFLKDAPPYRKSLESDESYIILCEQAAGVDIQRDNVLETEGTSQVSDDRSCDGEQITACLKTMECTDVNIMQQGKGNDSVKTVPYTCVKASGNTTNKVDPVEWKENAPRDGAQVAICDCSASKGEMHEANPKRKDSLETAKPKAVHVGKDTRNKDISEALPAVYVGNETDEEALNVVHNSNVPTDVVHVTRNDRNYKVQNEMPDEKNTTDEVQPVKNYGNDSVVSDGANSLAVGPPVQEKLHNEKDYQKAKQSAVHSEKSSRGMTLAVKPFSKMYRADWSSSYEVQTEMCDREATTDDALPGADYKNYSGCKLPSVVCDWNTPLAHPPPEPELSHDEKDTGKATLSAVHSENDSETNTLPVERYGKLYKDNEPAVLLDRKGFTDETLPLEQIGELLVSNTRVHPEIQTEVTSKDKVLPIHVFPVCYGIKCKLDEFDAPICPSNALREAAITLVDFNADICRESVTQKQKSMQGQNKSYTKAHVAQHSRGENSEIPHIAVGIPSEDITHTKVRHSQSENSEIPHIAVGIPSEDITHTKVRHSRGENSEIPHIAVGIPSEDITHTKVRHSQGENSEIPHIAVGIPSEDITHTKVLHSQGDSTVERQGQKVIPSIIESNSKDLTHTKVHNVQSFKKDTAVSLVCDGENYFSSNTLIPIPKVEQGTESVSTITTPTVNEVPYGYIPVPDIYSAGSLAVCNVDAVNKSLSRCPTPTQDEPPVVRELSDDHNVSKSGLLPDLNYTNIRSPDLSSGFAHQLIEPSLRHSIPNCSNNNIQNNPEASNGKEFSETLTDLCKKPIASSTPLNTASFSKKLDCDSLTEMRCTTTKQDMYAHSSDYSMHTFPDSYPETQYPITDKAAFFVPSIHPKILFNETSDINLTQDLREISGKAEIMSPASIELVPVIKQSIPVVSGSPEASQDLTVHNFTEPDSCSQRSAMVRNLLKNEDSREKYKKQRLLAVDPTSSVAYRGVHTDNPVLSNTNACLYNTPYVSEMRKIASLQDSDYVLDESKNPAVDQDSIDSSEKKIWISGKQHVRSKARLNKTKLDFINSLQLYQEWEKGEFDEVLEFSKPGTSSSVTIQSEESDKSLSHIEENKQKWVRYGRAKKSESQMAMAETKKEEGSSVTRPCLVTVLDPKGKRITYESCPSLKPTASMHSWTVPNSNKKTSSSFLEFSKRWDDTHNPVESDLTQSSMNLETLIFSEKMNQLLKHKKRSSRERYKRSRHHRSKLEERASTCNPAVTVRFSSLEEEPDCFAEHWEGLPPPAGEKITVEMPERASMAGNRDLDTSKHLQKTSYTKYNEKTHVKVSDLVEESFKAYHAMMNKVCAGRKFQLRTDRLRREEANRNSLPMFQSNNKDLCGQMKDMYDLNSVVRQSCKNKFRFYIMKTSDDPFFKETKELLKAEGHIEVEPSQFCLGSDIPLSPLHIILRNEDIAEHICKVPHLLELKKSQNVLFAGIDRPDDIVNLTHQELFCKGGFVVFDGAALDSLSLSNMKHMTGCLEKLSKRGKWKWLLHYRDSRKLKENARCNAEAKEKKCFMDVCQEAGMVEVLPYHDCDVISKDQPHHLHCLVRLQVQNISARLPVFITDTTADKGFANHGIFTMNISSFLLLSRSETCTIS